MKKILLIVVVAIGILVGGFYAFNSYIYNEKQAPNDGVPQEEPSVSRGAPTFEWAYRAFTEDEIPRSEISLIARYENGTVEEKVIDTIQGDCNAYVEPDADVYERSEMIICYYAGLGHYYKVVEAESAYLVQRKIFEEATPDYAPPQEDFETIAEIPFSS